LYVVLYSPLQMAADLPEHYESNLGAFQFIKDVPVDWDKTVVLNAEIGEFLTIARKEKNTENWYIGSATNKNKREFKLSLSFLEPNKKYKATLYLDKKEAHYLKNPTAYKIQTLEVDNTTVLDVSLACGGGLAIQIKEL